MLLSKSYTAAAMIWLVAMASTIDKTQGLIAGKKQPFIRSTRTRKRSSSSLNYIDYPMMDIPSLPPTSASVEIIQGGAKLITNDPQLEVEILNDVTHLALDVSTFLSPNTAWLRLFNVIGRVLILSSDYIQETHVTLDEWVFESGMLAISTQLFLRSVTPLMTAIFSMTALSVRDRRAYSSLFENVGLTILQFKSLLVTKTIDWVEYEPNTEVELDGEYMYFVYSGSAKNQKDTLSLALGASSSSRLSIRPPTSSNSDNQEGPRLRSVFGDVQFAEKLEDFTSKKSKKNSKSSKTMTNHTTLPSSFIAGTQGAAMLRISTSKLLKLMKDDNELTASIQRLVLHCMQEKLNRSAAPSLRPNYTRMSDSSNNTMHNSTRAAIPVHI